MKKVISVFGAVTLTASMFFPCTIVQAADVDTSAEEILIDEDQAIELLEAEDISTYKDGVYTGVGAGKRGDIILSVTISEGRVSELSEVSQKETPSFWEKAKALLTKIVELKPSYDEIDGIDTISGATVSSNGIKEALKDAFAQAKEAAENPEEPVEVVIQGSGTWDDPYQIGTVSELEKFAQNVDEGTTYAGEYVALVNDIDLSEVEYFNAVGTEDGFSIFAGNFDGNGHAISNAKVKAENASNAGFFTVLSAGATVKDLKLENAYVEATGDYSLYAGLVAGNIKKSAVIDHCDVNGQLQIKSDSATVEAGGIVGNMMLKSSVLNCSSNVSVNAELAEGIVGDFGGIAGLSKMNALVLNSAAAGTVTVSGSDSVQAGGILGNAMGNTRNVVSSVEVKAAGSAGAVFGVLDSFGAAADYYSVGTDLKPVGNTDEEAAKEVSVQLLNSNIAGLHQAYDSLTFYQWGEDRNSYKPAGEQWFETEIDDSIFEGGDGSVEDPFRIATKEQLVAFAGSLDNEILYDGKYVVLVEDIDISDIANWEPVGKSEFAFNGSFDGQGHTITGLREGTEDSPRKLSTNYEDFSNSLGFFGTLGVDAVVKNLNLTDVAMYVYRDDASFVGGIAGYMQGLTDESSRKGAIIDNCYVQGKIYSTTHENNAYVGGIAARQYKGAIINSHTDVDLRATVEYGESIASSGGITGMTNRGLVANCYTTGTYYGSMARDIENEIEGMSSVGGLIGVDAGSLVNCYVSGDMTSEHYSIYTGAVTGWITGIGKAYQCYYDQNGVITIAGRKEAEIQPYGTQTVGGVNEEGVAYEGGVSDFLEPYGTDSYSLVADKLNDNFSSFAIDITKYGLSENSLRTWEYRDGKVVLTDNNATVVYVQPEVEIVPVEPLVMQDGTWYGRDNTATVTVKILIKDGALASEELLTGSKEDNDKYESALSRAKNKAIYGDTTGYGAGDPSVFAGGDGTRENPYLVANEEQLRYVAEAICEDETWEGKYFRQTADIVLSDKEWKPIGFAIKAKIKGDPVLYSAYPFRGSFDGGNYTITGLKIGERTNPASQYTAAMFGFTGGDYESNLLFGDDTLKVELKNINLRDIYINNEVLYDTYTAGLVGTGQNGVFIDNCSVTGKISVKADDIASRGAGLAASMLRGAVTNSWTDVTISAVTEEGDVYAGGMFGVTNRITVANCYTLGDVYGTANTNNKVHIGGFTGMAGAFQYNCYAMGNVTSNRPTIDIGIMDGRIANIAYDRNCYFNSDAKLVENGVVIETVYTGADGTGSSKDFTFGKTAAEIGSQEFADILNNNIDNVVKELEAADEELGGIMSIYYNEGPSGLNRWVISDGKAVFGKAGSGEVDPEEPQPQPVVLKLVTKWGKTYCVTEDGTKLTGFQAVDGVTYFFALKNGAMVKSNFIEMDGVKYYALKDGTIAKNMLVSKWGTDYLFGEDGRLLTGFNTFNGNDYYSKENGVIAKSYWIRLEDGTYYAKGDGRLAKNETIKKWGKKYTFDENGRLINR
ncbi:FMN-binding protein [Butyrivibrio sp. MC2021]|uniref:FMN-binding protein n=1 Tax=Butyrivibrio sp. MC2021 TaxID=1408306 RepID=UPI0006883AD4|nr:FMN-binding protein [Butyrivibrio sp. MC2021]